MTNELHDTVGRIEQPLTVRPALSRAAVRFVESHPDEVERIVAAALETAAALDGAGVPAAARPPSPQLRRFIASPRLGKYEWKALSISEAAEVLEVTRVTIYAWIEAKRLLAWRATRRGVVIPGEQILGPGKVVVGLDRLLEVIPEPIAAWDFLTEESPYVDATALRRPMDALRAGEINAVIASAHSFLDAFA